MHQVHMRHDHQRDRDLNDRGMASLGEDQCHRAGTVLSALCYLLCASSAKCHKDPHINVHDIIVIDLNAIVIICMIGINSPCAATHVSKTV